jgi:hypothetical protein
MLRHRLWRQLLSPAAGAGGSGVRQVAQFLDAPNGPAVTQVPIEEEWYNRQRNLLALLDKVPNIEPDTWIAPNALVAGDVDIYQKVIASQCTKRGRAHDASTSVMRISIRIYAQCVCVHARRSASFSVQSFEAT